MRYRKLSATGDYVLGTGSDFLANSPAAVAQAVQTRLRLFLGEWFLDTTDGTPWRTEVLGKYTSQSYDAAIKARILRTQGVTQITQYSSTFDSGKRALSVSATIETVYGAVTVKSTL
jgi:hypothetical protein